jgi:hypothetical protein
MFLYEFLYGSSCASRAAHEMRGTLLPEQATHPDMPPLWSVKFAKDPLDHMDYSVKAGQRTYEGSVRAGGMTSQVAAALAASRYADRRAASPPLLMQHSPALAASFPLLPIL